MALCHTKDGNPNDTTDKKCWLTIGNVKQRFDMSFGIPGIIFGSIIVERKPKFSIYVQWYYTRYMAIFYNQILAIFDTLILILHLMKKHFKYPFSTVSMDYYDQ